jgi:sugar lactone lactonase YvrE
MNFQNMTLSRARMKTMSHSNITTRFNALFLSAVAAAGLVGCSAGMPGTSGSSTTTTAALSSMQGRVHGGQQPVAGAYVYLYGAGTGGYGGAATSLIPSSVLTAAPGSSGVDGNGNYYVITDANGIYNIPAGYSCVPGTVAYLYAAGGNSGNAVNSAIGLMSILGTCPAAGNFAAATPIVLIDEVSTVVAAYSMAGYATDATHVSSSGTTAAAAGIRNAFASSANVSSIVIGQAYTVTPAGNGTVPQQEINTLANILAACINSASSSSTACTTLFTNAKSSGSTGTVATDTATAAINIAHNPGSNVAALFQLASSTPPFAPGLSTQPNDFTIAIKYSGNGISTPQAIAIDGSGNEWIANANNSVTELSAGSGAALSGSTGYTSGNLDSPSGIAVDATGNVWVANCGEWCSGSANPSSLTVYVPGAGNTVTPTNLTGGSLAAPYGLAIDATGHAWVANAVGTGVSAFTTSGPTGSYTSTFQSNATSVAIDGFRNVYTVSPVSNAVTQFTSAGVAGGSGYQGSGVSYPFSVAIDASNRAWILDQASNAITVLNAGLPVTGSPFSGGGLSLPNGLALDGAGTAWISNATGTVSAFNNLGAPLSAASGYVVGSAYANNIAVDGSGNVWVSSCGSYCTGSGSDPGSVYEVIGAAAPVVTPIAAGVVGNQLATKP